MFMNENLIMENFGKCVRLYRYTQLPKVSQAKLAVMVKEKTNIKSMRQEKISQIELGQDASILEKEIEAIRDICGISKCVAEPYIMLMRAKHPSKINLNSVEVKENENLWVKYSHEEFNFYEGKYYCYFFSTDDDDPKIVKGIMNLYKSQRQNICNVKFEIIEDSLPIKRYDGQFFINITYSMSYCILVGEEKQEVCFLISDHYNASMAKENLFNVALVLTTSAGESKKPAMHKMIISRKKLPDESLQMIYPQLKLINTHMFVSKSQIELIKADYIQKIKETNNQQNKVEYKKIVATIDNLINNKDKDVYYCINEKSIYEDVELNEKNKRELISVLRDKANMEYTNRISKTTKVICKNIIEEI